jgi:hypothetical protein
VADRGFGCQRQKTRLRVLHTCSHSSQNGMRELYSRDESVSVMQAWELWRSASILVKALYCNGLFGKASYPCSALSTLVVVTTCHGVTPHPVLRHRWSSIQMTNLTQPI